MEIEFLGTGTSTGIPQIKCQCEVCKSNNPRDKRLRCSAVVRTGGLSLLIDCGPDFREQILRASSQKLDALLVTHSHYDHVGGVDDLRAYCQPSRFDIYAQEDVLNDLRNRIPYCFKEHPYPGVPQFNLHAITLEPFTIGDVLIEPLRVMHYKLPILGYKIGNMAYITDAKEVPDETINKIRGIDTLIINALRIEEHISHMSLSQSLATIARIAPRRAFLIHLSHDMGLHDYVSQNLLPPGVEIAFDTQIITVAP